MIKYVQVTAQLDERFLNFETTDSMQFSNKLYRFFYRQKNYETACVCLNVEFYNSPGFQLVYIPNFNGHPIEMDWLDFYYYCCKDEIIEALSNEDDQLVIEIAYFRKWVNQYSEELNCGATDVYESMSPEERAAFDRYGDTADAIKYSDVDGLEDSIQHVENDRCSEK